MKTNQTIMAAIIAVMLTTTFAQDSATEQLLIGRWATHIGGYSCVLTFQPGGLVTVDREPNNPGRWSIKDHFVVMEWRMMEHGHKTWESFDLPLNPQGTHGRSWSGRPVIASKITDGATESMQQPISQPNPSVSNPGSNSGNQVEQLQIFKKLLDQGLISKELYDQKVKAIIDGM